MKKHLFLLAGSVLLAITCSAQNTLFLAADGSGNAFTKQAPGNINDLTNKLKQVNPSGGPLAIFLKQGFYFLKKPLIINNQSVGGKFSKLLIAGEPGARATLCGGRPISG